MQKMRMVALMLAVVIVGLVLSCGGGGNSDAPPPVTREWTYLVYMGADNNLSSAGMEDLQEMATVGSSSEVAIVVQAEFSAIYTPSAPTGTRRYYIEKNDVSGGTSIGNVDMADPATLTAFIAWVKANYPAKRYALVVWDHGAGWRGESITRTLKGAVQDETSGTFMSLPQLAQAVSDSGVHFDLINFDACLMAMFEVAYEFNGLADYLVFSEETEPGDGDPYDTILAALVATPTMSGLTLSTTIVDEYNTFYASARETTTKSAVDMSQIPALDAKIIALSKALIADETAGGVVAAAQAGGTQEYAYPTNHDIYDFCAYLSTNLPAGNASAAACGEVMTAVTNAVVQSRTTGADVANSYGLAIYLPSAGETSAADLADYALLKCNLTTRAAADGTWGAYLESLTGGGSLTYGTGEYILYLYWTKPAGNACDADLDLYVQEPTATGGTAIFAPWMGQSTPNGFFSADSSASGIPEEYYVANSQVISGTYIFLVNYFADGATCAQARAHVLIMDPAAFGDTNWHEPFGPVDLDLSNSGTSDIWIVASTTRSFGEAFFALNGVAPLKKDISETILKKSKVSRLKRLIP